MAICPNKVLKLQRNLYPKTPVSNCITELTGFNLEKEEDESDSINDIPLAADAINDIPLAADAINDIPLAADDIAEVKVELNDYESNQSHDDYNDEEANKADVHEDDGEEKLG